MKLTPEKKLTNSNVASCSVNFSQDENKVLKEKFDQKSYLAKDLNDVKPEKSFAEKPKNKRYKMAIAAIFAVFVLQFVWQFSFIQNEKLLNVEKILNDIQLEELPAKIIVEQKSVEVQTVYVEKKAEIVSPEKNIMPIVYRQPAIKPTQPAIKPVQVEIKKKTSLKTKEEQLRWAEQLLTGF